MIINNEVKNKFFNTTLIYVGTTDYSLLDSVSESVMKLLPKDDSATLVKLDIEALRMLDRYVGSVLDKNIRKHALAEKAKDIPFVNDVLSGVLFLRDNLKEATQDKGYFTLKDVVTFTKQKYSEAQDFIDICLAFGFMVEADGDLNGKSKVFSFSVDKSEVCGFFDARIQELESLIEGFEQCKARFDVSDERKKTTSEVIVPEYATEDNIKSLLDPSKTGIDIKTDSDFDEFLEKVKSLQKADEIKSVYRLFDTLPEYSDKFAAKFHLLLLLHKLKAYIFPPTQENG